MTASGERRVKRTVQNRKQDYQADLVIYKRRPLAIKLVGEESISGTRSPGAGIPAFFTGPLRSTHVSYFGGMAHGIAAF